MGYRTEVVCFDLDSTLADTLHRQDMIPAIKAKKPGGPTWDTYSMACADDKPIEGTIKLASMLYGASYLVAIITGRSAAARKLTEDWLRANGVKWDMLLMRPAGDRTKNGEYKVGILRRLQKEGYEPVLFVEDYPEVGVEIREKTGVPVVLVNANYPQDAAHQNVAGV